MRHDYSARLGGIELRPYRSSPRPGEWVAQLRSRIEGWHKAPDKTSTFESATGDGQQRGLRLLDVRPMTLDLTIKASEQYGDGSLDDALDTISRLYLTTLRVTESARGLDREIDVRVEEPRINDLSPLVSHVTLPLIADDPLRHNAGSFDLYAGETWIANRGDRQAWPIIEAGGPVSFQIGHPGGTARINLPEGNHEISTRDGKVWSPVGVEVPDALTGPWPYVSTVGSLWTVTGFVSGFARIRRWEAWS